MHLNKELSLKSLDFLCKNVEFLQEKHIITKMFVKSTTNAFIYKQLITITLHHIYLPKEKKNSIKY